MRRGGAQRIPDRAAARAEPAGDDRARSSPRRSLRAADAVEYNNLRVEIDTKRALLDTLLEQQGETEVISRLRERADDEHPHRRPRARARQALQAVAQEEPRSSASFSAAASASVSRSSSSYLDRSSAHRRAGRAAPAASGARRRSRHGPAAAVRPKGRGRGSSARPRRPREDRARAATDRAAAARGAALADRRGVSRVPHGAAALAGGRREDRSSITSGFPQRGQDDDGGQPRRRARRSSAGASCSSTPTSTSPRLHEIFDIPNRVGLVSILAEGIEPSRAIVKTSVPGVFVVPAGPETPNPSGLLASDAMRKFLELAAIELRPRHRRLAAGAAGVRPLVFAHADRRRRPLRAGRSDPARHVIRARDRILRERRVRSSAS